MQTQIQAAMQSQKGAMTIYREGQAKRYEQKDFKHRIGKREATC